MATAAAAIALMLAVALSGCGGTDRRPVNGRVVFTQSCRACHSLDGHPSAGQQGGDLGGVAIGRRAMIQFVREMPVRRRLSAAEINAVSDYVRAVERGRRVRRLSGFSSAR